MRRRKEIQDGASVIVKTDGSGGPKERGGMCIATIPVPNKMQIRMILCAPEIVAQSVTGRETKTMEAVAQ